MTNITLLNAMWTKYNDKAFTHNYIIGFRFHGVVYSIITTADVVEKVITLSKASRGAGYAIRFKPTVDQKIFLINMGAKVLCSEKYFDEIVKNSKYNNGEIFEKMITESYGQVWEKDRLPFTDGGDIEVDGIAYQIKFEKASFASEKQLARL